MDILYRKLKTLKQNTKDENSIILEATVPSGLEIVAVKEIKEKLIDNDEHQICYVQGRVYFNTTVNSFEKVTNLRSVDNVNLVVDLKPNLTFSGKKEDDLNELANLVNSIDLLKSVKNWALISNFNGNIEPTVNQHSLAQLKQIKIFTAMKENIEINRENDEYKHDVLKFRVTCDRIGPSQLHSFTSNEAAYRYGGELNNNYHWIVALSDWDINVFLRIQENDSMVLLKLTTKSLHRRCLTNFGPTSLRPTIAFGMLSLANLGPGDHILDPLCGSGSIPIECMYAFPNTIINCGDIHHRAVMRTFSNINAQDTLLPKPSIFIWDASHLPFGDHSLDAIVTDLPFGKRSGSKRNNVLLYRKLTTEFARVLKYNTGRIVLLSKDVSNLFKALDYKKPESCWDIVHISKVNVGALKCNLILALLKNMKIFK